MKRVTAPIPRRRRTRESEPMSAHRAALQVHRELIARVDDHLVTVLLVAGSTACTARTTDDSTQTIVTSADPSDLTAPWVRRAVAGRWPARTRPGAVDAVTTVIDGYSAVAIVRVLATSEHPVISRAELARIRSFTAQARVLLASVGQPPSTVADDRHHAGSGTAFARQLDGPPSAADVVAAAHRLADAARRSGSSSPELLRGELRAAERAVADLLTGRLRAERRSADRTTPSSEWTDVGTQVDR